MTFPSTPYVYTLIDECGVPFYVGKGRGRRAAQHLKDALRGATGPRFDRIRDLISRGHEYRYEVVSEHDTDQEAAQAERNLIAAITGLANLTKGGEIGGIVDPRAVLSRRAAHLLKKLEAVGAGDHPIAILVRREVENPSPNVVRWCPDKGVTFAWHCDKSPGLPEHVRNFHVY